MLQPGRHHALDSVGAQKRSAVKVFLAVLEIMFVPTLLLALLLCSPDPVLAPELTVRGISVKAFVHSFHPDLPARLCNQRGGR